MGNSIVSQMQCNICGRDDSGRGGGYVILAYILELFHNISKSLLLSSYTINCGHDGSMERVTVILFLAFTSLLLTKYLFVVLLAM